MDDTSPSLAGRYFVVTLLLSLPVILGFLLVGLGVLSADVAFPMVAVVTAAPLLAGLAVTPRGHRRRLLRRAVDWKALPHPGWLLPATLLVPAVLVLAMLLLSAAGVAIGGGQAPVFALPVLFVVFLLMGTAEELGWMGVAFEPLVARMGRTGATTTLALVWVAWHLPFYLATFSGPSAVLAQASTMVALRFVMVWIYERAGRNVFIVSLTHASYNLALAAVPVYGMAEPLGMWVVAGLMVALAAALWVAAGTPEAAGSTAGAAVRGGMR